MLNLFMEKRRDQIKLIVGILVGGLVMQTVARALTDYVTVLPFENVSALEWRTDLSHLLPGDYYMVVGRPQGVCNIKVDGKVWDSNRSGLPDIRTHLFLGVPFHIDNEGNKPGLATINCVPQEGFSTSFYKSPAIMRFGYGVVSLLLQEVYCTVIGPVFSFFLICSLFLTTAISRKKLALNGYFLLFAVLGFFYSCSLAHLTSLFLNGPTFTFFHIFIRICYSLSFILLCGSYSRQRKASIILHLIILSVLFWYLGSPSDTANFYYKIYFVFPLCSFIAFYDLFKITRCTKFVGILTAIAGSWTIFQIRDYIALRAINGYYSGPLMISIISGFLAYFNYRQGVESEKETENLKRQLEIKNAITDLSAQIAHDIRSPLAFLRVIGEDSSFAPEVRGNLNSAVMRLNGIVAQLLSKNREGATANTSDQQRAFVLSKEEFSEVGLKETVLKLIEEKKITLGKDSKIHFEFKMDSEREVTVRVQLFELERLLSNLLNNSIEALLGRGRIFIEITKYKDEIVLSIVDTGRGVDPQVLNTLGEYGKTYGKLGGSGLGLFHAKNTIESWRGDFRIFSEKNVGTTIRIVFRELDN